MRKRDKRRRAQAKAARAYEHFKFPKTPADVATSEPVVDVETIVKSEVRRAVMERDRDCRFPVEARWRSPCHLWPSGALQWAHRTQWRRARTLGLPPTDRHTTAGSMALCAAHHEAYDHGLIIERAVNEELGANSLLRWYLKDGEPLGEG